MELFNSDDGTWEDVFGTKDLSLDRALLKLDLLKFSKDLKPIEQTVIDLMYFNGGMGYKEAGDVLGRSKQNIEQIAYRAVRKIKSAIVESWNKEHKTNLRILTSQKIEFLRRVNLNGMHSQLQKEEKANKKIYKEILSYHMV